MDFKTIIQKRHASRFFTKQPVDPDVLNDIITDAKRAPSWANAQPWQVVIATGETLAQIKAEHLDRSRRGVAGNTDMAVAHRSEWAPASRQNIATFNDELNRHLMAQDAQATYGQSQDQLFNAAALVYLVLREPVNDWAIFDLGAFSQTLMLSATNHGVDSIPAYELIRYPDELRKRFKLDETHRFIMGIALGYQDQAVINDFRSSRVANADFLTIKD
ncbi:MULTISPECIES: nitroreductase [Lactobacillaceae]|uniref:nitroreductase n=1 Tax=Lactobacillaceae TaxID=33958 RepID=UPI0014563428|nr:nitroreductase [Lactobacillus sp. HBUAS51381]NLR09373.1 nitroreductase [Lactobacillus sp. HBUAS51381]